MPSPKHPPVVFLALVSFCFLWLTGCHCPPDESAGEWYLDRSLTRQMPYQGNERLLFVNGQGDSSTFRSYLGIVEDSVKLNVAQLCAKDLFDVQHLFYHSNQYSIQFLADNDDAKQFELSWRLLPIDTAGDMSVPSQVVGYMTLDAWVMDFGLKVIFDDFGEPLPPEAEYYQHGIYVPDTVLVGQRFTDVYLTEDQSEKQTAIFYQPQQGLIGFRDQAGATWVLEQREGDRLELGKRIQRADEEAAQWWGELFSQNHLK